MDQYRRLLEVPQAEPVKRLKTEYELYRSLRSEVVIPALVPHGRFAAAGADPNIDASGQKDLVPWSILGESGFEVLVSLKLKQDPKELLLDRIGQESKVADLLEPFRKDMEKESADEFIPGKSHLLQRIVILIIAVTECDGFLCDIDDTAIGDRHPMGIAAQIGNGIAVSVEGLLDVGDPVGSVKIIDKFLPVHGSSRIGEGLWKGELTRGTVLFQRGHELAAEHFRGGFGRYEEAVPTFAKLPVP